VTWGNLIQDLTLDASGHLLLAAIDNGGLAVYDLENPAAPRLLARDSRFFGVTIAAAGSCLYLGDYDGQVAVYSLYNPARPRLINRFQTAGSSISRLLSDREMLLAATNRGLEIYDLAQPRRPRLAATLAADWRISDLGINPAGALRYDLLTGNAGVLFSFAITDLTPIDLLPPEPVSALKVVDRGFTGLRLQWQNGADNPGGSGFGGCLIYRDDLGDRPIAEIAAPRHRWLDNDCEPGRNYSYSVRSFDRHGNLNPVPVRVSALTRPLSADRTNPAAPTALRGRTDSERVLLDWNQSFDFNGSGIAAYEIFRSAPGETLTRLGETGATSWCDRDLAAGTTYFYFVRARDQVGRHSTYAILRARTRDLPDIPLYRAYMTHHLNSREQPWKTRFSFTNPTAAELDPAPSFRAWKGDGELDNFGAIVPRSHADSERIIPALYQIYDHLMDKPISHTADWFEYGGENRVIGRALMSEGCRIDFVAPAPAATELLFSRFEPRPETPAWVGITLVNPSDQERTFQATARADNGGILLQGPQLSLPGHGKWVGRAEDLFVPGLLPDTGGYLTVSADGPLAGSQFFAPGPYDMAVLPGHPQPEISGESGFHLYTIFKTPLFAQASELRVSLVNQGSQSNPVLLYWQDRAGLVLAEKRLELPASGRILVRLPASVAVDEFARLEIVSSYPCAVDQLRTPRAARAGCAAAPAINGASNELNFPLLLLNPRTGHDWLTIANQSRLERNRVTIDFRCGNGELLLRRTLELPPAGVEVRSLRELVGTAFDQLRNQGLWLHLTGTHPLAGLQASDSDGKSFALQNAEDLR